MKDCKEQRLKIKIFQVSTNREIKVLSFMAARKKETQDERKLAFRVRNVCYILVENLLAHAFFSQNFES